MKMKKCLPARLDSAKRAGRQGFSLAEILLVVTIIESFLLLFYLLSKQTTRGYDSKKNRPRDAQVLLKIITTIMRDIQPKNSDLYDCITKANGDF